ncbi:hypothetical protein CRUP_031794, partial [Coryphaenoides rupestris]
QPAPELYYYTYDYNDCDHPSEVLGAFSQFYLSGLFTDVSLRGAAGRVFHCHHAMLAACSTYFRAMFTTDMRDRAAHGRGELPGGCTPAAGGTSAHQEDLAQQEEFLELLAAELRSLLSPKNDVAPDVWWEDDDVLLLAVARWVTYDLDNCIGHTKDLLSSID